MKNTDNTLQNLLDKSFSEFNLVQGSLVKANIVEIGKKWVTLDTVSYTHLRAHET